MSRAVRRASRRWLLGVALLASSACAEVRDAAAGRFTPATPGTLVVGADLPDPGFWEGTADDVTGGFEFELAKALADELDLELSVVQVPFGDVVAGRLGAADVVLEEVSVTDARRDHVRFSVPYLTTSPTVLARRDGGDAAELRDLATAREQRWAVRANTTEQRYLADVVRPDDDPIVLPDAAAVLAAVEDGTADAALVDLSAALIAANDSDSLVAVARFDASEDVAAVLPHDASANTEAVDQAIRRLRRDGTLERLIERWLVPRFSTDPERLPVIATR